MEPIEKALWKKHEARSRGEKTTGGIKGYEKQEKTAQKGCIGETEGNGASADTDIKRNVQNKVVQEKVERYKTRLNLFSRLSERQRGELIRQITADTSVPIEIKEELLESAKELRRQDNYEKLKEKVAGAKMPRVSMNDFREFDVPVPPMELQNQFDAFVEQTDKSKLAIQQSLDKLELLKKSLMQEYFG